MNRYNNRYNYSLRKQYNKEESFNRKNRLISVLIILSLTLLFIINHLHYENKSLNSDMNTLTNEVEKKDIEILNLKKEIDSLKPKTIQVIEKPKPKINYKKIKKDTSTIKTPTVVIVDTLK